MLTPKVTIHFGLSWRACIRHRHVISSRPHISHWAVLWRILRTCISIRWAATGPTSEFRWHISSRLLCPIAMVLGRIIRLWRCHLLCLQLLTSFLKSSLKAIFHAVSSLTAWLGSIYTSDINLRSLFSHYCLIEIIIIVSPPLWVYEGIKWSRSWFQSSIIISLSNQEITPIERWVVRSLSLAPLWGWFWYNLKPWAASTWYSSRLFCRPISYIESWSSNSSWRRWWICHSCRVHRKFRFNDWCYSQAVGCAPRRRWVRCRQLLRNYLYFIIFLSLLLFCCPSLLFLVTLPFL